MRRVLLLAALALTLVVGPMASPAAAHHTHSAYTLCSEKLLSQVGPDYRLVNYGSYYNSVGHPTVARCTYQHKTTFTTKIRCFWYSTHAARTCAN